VPIDLHPQKLTTAVFAPYGDVIACDKDPVPINNGTTERFHDLARIDVTEKGGRALVNIFRGIPFSLPLRITMMECHPLGSQAFMPLTAEPYLVVVAPPGAAPDPVDLAAFFCEPGQGVNYARGTWHHPLIALNRVSDFLVIDRGAPERSGESGPNDNLDEHFYPEETEIRLHGAGA